MDIYKVKWTRLQEEIFRFLCVKTGMKFNARAIAKELNVSPTAVSNALPGLEKDGMIKVAKSETMNLFSIEFNRDSQRAIDFKRVENLKMLYESGLDKFLEDSFPGCTIILFGSYGRGDDVADSDIDIAVVEGKEKEVEIEHFEKILQKTININFYISFKKIHKHLLNNILNGILLSGSVDL